MKRYFALLILISLMLSLLSCGREEEKEYVFADDTLIMTVENVPITYDLYRFYYLSMKASYENFDESAQKELKDQCIEAVKFYAALYVLSERKGINLTQSDHSKVSAQIADYEDFYGQDGYTEMLSQLYHTRSSHSLTLEWQLLRKKCAENLEISEDDVTVLVRQLMKELEIHYEDAFDCIVYENIK